MDVERRAVVESIDSASVGLRLAPSCDGCGSCGGRCNLLGDEAARARIDLPHTSFDVVPITGQVVRIYLPAASLWPLARRGYGLPLLGLLIGALLSHGIAVLLALDMNVAAVIGACMGTLTGLLVSNRPMTWPCRVAPLRDGGDGHRSSDRPIGSTPDEGCNT